jgi:hypothetical protein
MVNIDSLEKYYIYCAYKQNRHTGISEVLIGSHIVVTVMHTLLEKKTSPLLRRSQLTLYKQHSVQSLISPFTTMPDHTQKKPLSTKQL